MSSKNQKNDPNKKTAKTNLVFSSIIISIISMIFSFLSIDHDVFFSLSLFFDSEIKKFSCSERMAESEGNRITYVFVLDISTSYNNEPINPVWFDDQRKKINTFLASDENFGNKSYDKPPLFMVCKVKLCQALLEFSGKEANFEIWTIGDNAKTLYCGKLGRDFTQREEVKKAIKEIVNLQQDPANSNTDFVNLFESILSNHRDLLMRQHSKEDLPAVVMILVSDLLHDVNLNPKSRDFGKRLDIEKIKLDNVIGKIAKRDILVDVIELSPEKIDKHEIPIWEILNRNKFENTRLKRISLKDEDIDRLFPTIRCQNGITFYNNYATKILKSSAYLHFDKTTGYSINMRLDSYNPDRNLNFEVVNINGTKEKSSDSYNKKGTLFSGGNSIKLTDLENYESIKFTCSTSFPSGGGFPDLKVSFREEKIEYSIPVLFREKPLSLKQNVYGWAIFILLSLAFFLIIQLFRRLVRLFLLKFKSKKRAVSKPSEVPWGINSINDGPTKGMDLIPCRYDCGYDHVANSAFCPMTGKPLLKFDKIKKNTVIIVLAIVISVLSINYFLLTSGKSGSLIGATTRNNTAIKEQLEVEKKKRKEAEEQFAAEKKKSKELEQQLIAEKEETAKAKERLTQKKTGREVIETQLSEEKRKREEVQAQLEVEIATRRKVEKQLTGEKTKRERLEEQLRAARREKEKTKSEKALDFLKLQPEMKNKYNSKLRIVGLDLPGGIETVGGELNLILAVDKNGTIMIQQFINDYMKVFPEEKTNDIKKMISKRIRNIYLPIPRKRDGTPVKIENWGLRFEVTEFEGIVTLKAY